MPRGKPAMKKPTLTQDVAKLTERLDSLVEALDDEYSSDFDEEQRPQPRRKGTDIEALAKAIAEQTHDVHLKVPEFDGKSDADVFIEWLDKIKRMFNYKKYGNPKQRNISKRLLEFGIPLFVRKVVDSRHSEDSEVGEIPGSFENLEEPGVSPLQLRIAAMALLRHGPRMPSKRRDELTQGVSVDRRISEKEDGHVSDSDEDRESQITVNGIIAPKCDQKLSLLGHGPHGKQVIEHILNEYGEDGIGQFCQRWRQVFVEAIHPRFLPVGWDVMHSGRQDFGDYSIFNTTKTATAVV
ncbi:hypothetical protein GIB67_011520 [Kingdonia uniflora]|uniref:Uncharacterized protein n=1 Tax=Kingdonia uniflora TaxID=39325 RepID=A0A7J7NLR5_9MAGN|nr:hypothetical protein GIB67_011520 [Kingdonia uniflora]